MFDSLLKEYSSDDDFKELSSESEFMNFLVLFCRSFKLVCGRYKNPGIYTLISEIQNYIEENYRQDISLEEYPEILYRYVLSFKQFKLCTGYIT